MWLSCNRARSPNDAQFLRNWGLLSPFCDYKSNPYIYFKFAMKCWLKYVWQSKGRSVPTQLTQFNLSRLMEKKWLPLLLKQSIIFLYSCNKFSVKAKVAQSRPTLCDPMDYTVHGILQARILEWVAFPFSRGSSQPRDRTQVSRIAGRFFTSWATREAQEYWSG